MDLPKTELVDTARRVTFSWLQRLIAMNEVAEAARKIGPTSARPAKPYPGQQYFDTDLGPTGDEIGRPIWAAKVETSGVTWVDADGVVV